jgi:cation diffusion facilitator CzcD-associated flavoprotein CzcO
MDHEIIIIGAGISGIGAAIMLNKQGMNDLLILERSNDIGGTWRDNKYPGVAVDIPSFVYQYSFEPNPRWTRMFAQGHEIYQYIHHCAKKYDVNKYIRFNAVVEKIVFNKDNNTWTTYLTDKTELVSRYVIAATGILYNPIIPQIKGQETFKGESRHTIKWDADFDIKNKNVGIIGTGATAVQVVPAIAPNVKHLTVFQRTPIWLNPKNDYVFDKEKIEEWTNHPLKYKRKQWRAALWIQGATWAIQNYKKLGGNYRKYAEKPPSINLKKQIQDPELRKKLTPDYAMGCKRPAISSDYFKTFNRDNVSLITEGIDRITENGILTKDGKEIPLDVIIYSTGFKTTEKGNFPNFKVIGSGTDELNDFWDKNKYQSYQGVSVPGYPNFFLTSGPFTFGLNWFSMLETNLHFIIRVIKKAKKDGATLIDVNHQAHEKHYKMLQERAKNAVQLSPSCSTSNSYYIDKNGDFALGAVFTPFYRWLKVRIANLNGYQFTK